MPRRIVLKPGAISDVCDELGVSRDELARRMQFSTATGYRIDNGIVDPSPRFIAALIEVAGKGFEDLFEIVGDEPVPAVTA